MILLVLIELGEWMTMDVNTDPVTQNAQTISLTSASETVDAALIETFTIADGTGGMRQWRNKE